MSKSGDGNNKIKRGRKTLGPGFEGKLSAKSCASNLDNRPTFNHYSAKPQLYNVNIPLHKNDLGINPPSPPPHSQNANSTNTGFEGELRAKSCAANHGEHPTFHYSAQPQLYNTNILLNMYGLGLYPPPPPPPPTPPPSQNNNPTNAGFEGVQSAEACAANHGEHPTFHYSAQPQLYNANIHMYGLGLNPPPPPPPPTPPPSQNNNPTNAGKYRFYQQQHHPSQYPYWMMHQN